MQDFETYVDSLEHLPPEFERNITLLKDLDTRINQLFKPVNDIVREYKRTPCPEKRRKMREMIEQSMEKMISYGTDKIEVVRLTYEMIDRQITALTEFLPPIEQIGPETTPLPGFSMPISNHEPTFCYCQQVSHGTMIQCDNPECPIEWFHLPCTKLKVLPPKKQKWFCERCYDYNNRRFVSSAKSGESPKSKKSSKPKKAPQEPTRKMPSRRR